jgi:hypothetical protein
MQTYLVKLRTRVANLTDRLEHLWEERVMRGTAGSVLVVTYLAMIVLIELHLRGWLFWIPERFVTWLPDTHFFAVEVAFTLLLLTEVVSLIFGLTRSFSRSIGIQIEILALILLRDAFKKFTTFGEPLQWELVTESLYKMVADGVGALLIFVILAIYYKTMQHQPITDDDTEKVSFIAYKKVIALGLILIFTSIGIVDAYRFVTGGETYPFFETFYTILIFTDVLMVLLSMRYTTNFAVTFRNFTYALVTVFIRLALVAPAPINAIMGVGTALFALSMGITYRFVGQDLLQHSQLGGVHQDANTGADNGDQPRVADVTNH